MWTKLIRRLRYWREQDARHARLNEEMQFHIEALTEELKAQGGTFAGSTFQGTTTIRQPFTTS